MASRLSDLLSATQGARCILLQLYFSALRKCACAASTGGAEVTMIKQLEHFLSICASCSQLGSPVCQQETFRTKAVSSCIPACDSSASCMIFGRKDRSLGLAMPCKSFARREKERKAVRSICRAWPNPQLKKTLTLALSTCSWLGCGLVASALLAQRA
jgi:hypothetical protein